jgi:hypothetical protein
MAPNDPRDPRRRNSAGPRIPITDDPNSTLPSVVYADPDSIGAIGASIARFRVGTLWTLGTIIVALCFAAFTLHALSKEVEKKVDRELLELKLGAIDKDLDEIKDLQKQQIRAAMEAAAEQQREAPRTRDIR